MQIIFLTNEIDLDAKGGGAQRSNVLVKAIEDSIPTDSTFEVIPISFYAFERMPEAQIFDLPVSQDIEFAINLRKILEKEPWRLKDLIKTLLHADYIFVDNCYLAPFIQFIMKQKEKRPEIIYISHNYETDLKANTAKLLNWQESKAKHYLKEVSEIENYLWGHSKLRIVCAINDGLQLNKLNSKEFLHIPNGGYVRKPPKLSKEKVLNFLGCSSYSLFVASGHPPNVNGFLEGIGIDFGFIPQDSRLVLVGSSVGPIEAQITGTKFHETFLKKGSSIPEASDELLDNLYAYSNSIALPIFSGSGTSIKSAEALLSNKHLIASKFAFRGITLNATLESQIDFCESQEEFKSAIYQSLVSPPKSSELTNDILNLEWSHILMKATMEMKNIFQMGK